MDSFLQTKDWVDFQKSLGRNVWGFDDGPPSHKGFGEARKIKANVIEYDLPFRKNYLYIPHGPEIDLNAISGGLKNELSNFVSYLKRLGKENKSIFVKIEPLSDTVIELLYPFGFKKSKKEIQPRKTVLVDLNLAEEVLLFKMHHKTRYNIKLAEKKGLNFVESDNVNDFWKLLKNTAKKDKFYTHPHSYYEKLMDFFKAGRELGTKMFFVNYNNKPIAAAILMFYNDTVYYLHGAMDREYKNLMAPYLLHWEIIKMAKGLGYHFYDLWGLDSQKWPGVTRFKLGWAGETREYPGSFDLPISRFWYLVYRIMRKIF